MITYQKVKTWCHIIFVLQDKIKYRSKTPIVTTWKWRLFSSEFAFWVSCHYLGSFQNLNSIYLEANLNQEPILLISHIKKSFHWYIASMMVHIDFYFFNFALFWVEYKSLCQEIICEQSKFNTEEVMVYITSSGVTDELWYIDTVSWGYGNVAAKKWKILNRKKCSHRVCLRASCKKSSSVVNLEAKIKAWSRRFFGGALNFKFFWVDDLNVVPKIVIVEG